MTMIIVCLIELAQKFKDHKRGMTAEVRSGYAEILRRVIKDHMEKVESEGLSWKCIG